MLLRLDHHSPENGVGDPEDEVQLGVSADDHVGGKDGKQDAQAVDDDRESAVGGALLFAGTARGADSDCFAGTVGYGADILWLWWFGFCQKMK